MVDLRAKPYFLDDRQIAWVEDTLGSMTLDEKLGQLFVILKAEPGFNEERICAFLNNTHQGGLRWQGGSKEDVYRQSAAFQKYSKIPLLIAANCDEGGNGCLPDGTFVSTAAEAGAGDVDETAYRMGLVSGREASSIGCNWMFNPIADIYMNWRNTIVNTRSFGESADTVIRGVRAYIRGVKDANPNMACCCKHFPGDGVEERDQHLVMGVNDLSVEEWNNSFRRVYQSAIDEGLESVMVGHIALPEMSRKLRPGIQDSDIMPATLSYELIGDLLRGEMGFNGLVITDATHMGGFTARMRREDALPRAVAAGCDMILFANDVEEDRAFIKAAYEKGIITEERLSDALRRILGLKAKLHLYDKSVLIPDAEDKDRWVGCEEHRAYTAQAADRSVTLVKDTRGLVPVDPNKLRRVFLVYVANTPNSRGFKGDPVKSILVEELERAGFEVEACPSFYELELENGVTPMNFLRMMNHQPRSKFCSEHDMVLLVMNLKGYAQENSVRLRWSCNHSCELPWYNEELPTVGMSLNFTNHLIDVPQLHTLIHAYGANRENIRAAIEKMCGISPFNGKAGDSVFCGRWETKL